jgi:hypothetical protein
LEIRTRTSAFIKRAMEEHGHVTDVATNGRNHLFLAAPKPPIRPRRASSLSSQVNRLAMGADPARDMHGSLIIADAARDTQHVSIPSRRPALRSYRRH